jgi:hypothetical protein
MDLAEELVTELMRNGLAIAEALGSLLESLPDDAFPGEDHAHVLIEMVTGSCAPVIAAAGEATCRDAIALMAAIGDKVFADLRVAAERAAS